MILFKHAIVRLPCQEMVHGLTAASLGAPDYQKAMDQHVCYVEALRSCGLKVLVLESDSIYPDSTFVEDVALCTSDFAIVTNPGAPSRNGERIEMKAVLHTYFDSIDTIEAPGTLPGLKTRVDNNVLTLQNFFKRHSYCFVIVHRYRIGIGFRSVIVCAGPGSSPISGGAA